MRRTKAKSSKRKRIQCGDDDGDVLQTPEEENVAGGMKDSKCQQDVTKVGMSSVEEEEGQGAEDTRNELKLQDDEEEEEEEGRAVIATAQHSFAPSAR